MDVDRRGFLKTVGGTVVGAAGAGLGVKHAPDNDGIDLLTEYGVPSALDEYLHEYGTTANDVLDPYEKDLLVELWYIDDATLSCGVKEKLYNVFSDEDITVSWFERGLSSDVADRYGNSADNLLNGSESLYEQEVPEVAQRHMIQAFVLPYDTIDHMNCDGDQVHRRGVANAAKLTVENRSNSRLFGHELIHTGGVPHDYNNTENDGLMGHEDLDDVKLDYTDRELAIFKYAHGLALTYQPGDLLVQACKHLDTDPDDIAGYVLDPVAVLLPGDTGEESYKDRMARKHQQTATATPREQHPPATETVHPSAQEPTHSPQSPAATTPPDKTPTPATADTAAEHTYRHKEHPPRQHCTTS